MSLFQPTFNTTAVPVLYPAPSPSDVSICNEYYSRVPGAHIPPPINDCRQAFKMLPIGNRAMPWSSHYFPEAKNVLPIKVHHGGCEIVFHTSGPEADMVNPTWIVPNDIRDMASWVLAKCVFGRRGGMVTKNLANSIDYVTDPTKDFWSEFPAAITSYYSLHIWNYEPEEEALDWNPGDSDSMVADKIADALKLASQATSGADQEELDARLDFVQEGESAMERDDEGRVWWSLDSPMIDFAVRNMTTLFDGTRTTRNRTISNG